MLKRLVGQIVSCFEEKWIDDIECRDLKSIGGLLELLAKTIDNQPAGQAIFFTLDSISLYYISEWENDVIEIVKAPLRLSAHSSYGSIIKILFTS